MDISFRHFPGHRRAWTLTAALGIGLLTAVAAWAGGSDDDRGRGKQVELVFTLDNLTAGITFRPFMVAAHPAGEHLFEVGTPSSAALQLMAECGATDAAGGDSLADQMAAVGANFVANPVNDANPFEIPLGLLFPAGTQEGDTAVPFAGGLPGSVSGTLMVERKRNTHLSVAGMLLPTNDAFAGLDAVRIPKKGRHVYYLSAYDAGTEANSEIMADDNPLDCVPNEPGYPVDPMGNTGTGGSGDAGPAGSPRVHVHPGNVGDLDPAGGFSDLDPRIHSWHNPVARLTIEVRR